jgi:hypothetical protein
MREGRENIQKRDEAGFIYSYNDSNRAFIGYGTQRYGYVFATIGFQDPPRSKSGWDKGSIG